MSHPVVRWQIVSPDAARTAEFYTSLFDWRMSQANPLGYRELSTGTDGMDGGVWPAPQADRPFVLLFVAVADVDEQITMAEKLGAKVLVPASTLPDGDRMAVLLDPSGMSFGLCTLRDSR